MKKWPRPGPSVHDMPSKPPRSLVGDREVRVTASIGVSQALGAADTMEQLIDRADQALIVAKKLGRNRVMCAFGHERVGRRLGASASARCVVPRRAGRRRDDTPVRSLAAVTSHGRRRGGASCASMHINSAPVVDAQGKLVGVLSEKDVICVLPNS